MRITPDAPFCEVEYYVLMKKRYQVVGRDPLYEVVSSCPRGLTLRGVVVNVVNKEAQEGEEVQIASSSAL